MNKLILAINYIYFILKYSHTFIPGLHKCRIFKPSKSINKVHCKTGCSQTVVASSIKCKPSSQICKACRKIKLNV